MYHWCQSASQWDLFLFMGIPTHGRNVCTRGRTVYFQKNISRRQTQLLSSIFMVDLPLSVFVKQWYFVSVKIVLVADFVCAHGTILLQFSSAVHPIYVSAQYVTEGAGDRIRPFRHGHNTLPS